MRDISSVGEQTAISTPRSCFAQRPLRAYNSMQYLNPTQSDREEFDFIGRLSATA